MFLSASSTLSRKRGQIVAIDIGTRTSKAVWLQKKDAGFELTHYAVQDAPISEKSPSVELLAEHLKQLTQTGGGRTKHVSVAIGVNDAMLRTAELPQMSTSEMRQVLKYNSKAYFQQDFPDYSFDCHLLASSPDKSQAEAAKLPVKLRTLVAGIKRPLLEGIQSAVKSCGLIPDLVTLNPIGAVNAFELAQPQEFAQGPVALVDIGFKTSTITLILNGELSLSRVVSIGGDRLTTGLSESMNISYPEAEGIKIGMPDEVQSAILPLLMPLGRELRASIDFFEHQQDRAVTQVYISGGTARSAFIVEALQSEMMVPCQIWNPLAPIQIGITDVQALEALQLTVPLLGAAVGAAIAGLS